MHIQFIPNRGSTPTVLLRESYRVGSKVCKRTLANLSSLGTAQIESIRAALRGEVLHSVEKSFEINQSLGSGHVQAVSSAMKRLGFAALISSKASPERDQVLAMVASRILSPQTKLATTRWWHTTTLAKDFCVEDCDENDLYAAMDWLLERQDVIQKQLAKRHLAEGGLVLYDLSSSYFEGCHCPLAKLGYNRDGKKGMLQVNYGLLTDSRGCPVAVSVHEGNTSDSKTFMPAVQKLRKDYGIQKVVMVGDRGMVSQKAIDELNEIDGMGWITALKSVQIRALLEQGQLQMGLFDDRNLLELSSPDFPNERLMACRNNALANLRAHKREALLLATEGKLEKIVLRVKSGKLSTKENIGLAVGKIIDKFKVEKHFELTIGEAALSWKRKTESIASEAALDGLYIIRTSVTSDQMDASTCVRNYKSLANVERAFRSIKTLDLKVRPIHHRTADRVKAHILLCMLAYYVEWHMREAWRELMFTDTEQAIKATRDPVAPAKRSKSAQEKASSHLLPDGTPAHSFATLMDELATIVRNTCRTSKSDVDSPTFEITTTPNAKQKKALELIQTMSL